MVIGLRPCSNERELTWRYPVVVALFASWCWAEKGGWEGKGTREGARKAHGDEQHVKERVARTYGEVVDGGVWRARGRRGHKVRVGGRGVHECGRLRGYSYAWGVAATAVVAAVSRQAAKFS
ncbi:hypothetical protein KM043_011145 [Ampulex compressa]|nr:hypothetical protein KM043_011145 [Ampulex compressa]